MGKKSKRQIEREASLRAADKELRLSEWLRKYGGNRVGDDDSWHERMNAAAEIVELYEASHECDGKTP